MSRTCPECQTQYDDEILHCPEDGLDLSTVEPDDELIGRSIGSYRVVKPLGKGGMGAVYMAEHPVIGSKVAIKFLHPQYATDKKIVDRFFNEARAVNVIGHDNILKIIDLSVTDDNRHYFIMEFLHGKALQDLMKPDVPMPLDVAGPVLLQVCEALQAAHEHKIIHRDLKPDNVYLIVHKGKKNFVKVVDFGIAKLTDEQGQSTGKTQTGMVMGTPAYMSPEQAGGMTTRIDARSDIYSLGCMMYQMATGKLPFPGSSFGEVLIGHLQLPPPPIREANPEVPEAYEAVIMKCLEKPQDKRYQSMDELHDAILEVMTQLGISRELPVADAAELAAAQTGTRTKSSPGAPKTPVKAAPRPALPKKTPPATFAQPQATAYQPPPMPPPRSRMGLFVGLGAGGVAIVGGIVFVLMQQQAAENRRAAERAAQLVIEQQRREDEAKKAEEAAKAQENEKVFLSVVSEPLGALAEATWKDGAKAGATPLEISVPKNRKVHLAFSKREFLPYATDVIADTPQVVKATLQPEPKAPPKVVKPRDEESARKAKPASDSKNADDTIPVEF
ncbi:MAG: serine/threonine protein kinase [Myxococcales bacterium]|nr:serine/threonine protein kinase [Myxococcales bacterium]